MEKKKLKAKQILAANLIASGANFTDIATRLGIQRRTLYEWRKLPEFNALVTEQTQEICYELNNRYIALADASAQAVKDALAGKHGGTCVMNAVRFIDEKLAKKVPESGSTAVIKVTFGTIKQTDDSKQEPTDSQDPETKQGA